MEFLKFIFPVTQPNERTETFVAILTCSWSDVSLVRSVLLSSISQLTILFKPSRPSSNAVSPKKPFLLIYISVHFPLSRIPVFCTNLLFFTF